jgi:hypothetical protein
MSGALSAIREDGGGLVEAYPEQAEGRGPHRGAYFHTGPEDLFAGRGSLETAGSPSGAG